MKRYTYEDWMYGRVMLRNSTFVTHERDLPLIVEWKDFEKADVIKIRAEQRQIFQVAVQRLLEHFKNHFLLRYNSSLLKDQLVEQEMEQCRDILFGSVTNEDYIMCKYWNFAFQRENLINIQLFIQEMVVQGKTLDYDFVLPVGNRHQIKDTIPTQVYAKCLWEYSLGLQSHFRSITPITEAVNERNDVENWVTIVPDNPYPHVFRSGYVYNFFLELKEMLGNTYSPNTDYAFIFHKMKGNNLLVSKVRQKTFTRMLSDNFSVKIKHERLRPKPNIAKSIIFDILYQKFTFVFGSII